MADKKSTGVLAAVVGAVATGVVTAAMVWLAPLWAWLVNLAGAVWVHLSTQSSIPNWAAYLLSLISATTALSLALRYWRSRKDNHERFTQFVWAGVRWRWRYISGRPDMLTPYCPHCDMLLVYDTIGGDRLSGTPLATELHCEHCRAMRLREEGAMSDVKARAARQVDRLIRTDKWRGYVDTPPG